MTLSNSNGRIPCRECGHRSHSLLRHIGEEHGSLETYLEAHPGAPTVSQKAYEKWIGEAPRRRRAPPPENLKVKGADISLPVDVGVSAEDCLPSPEGYRWPTRGKAKKYVQRVLMALARNRPLYIHGMPGTGKDAVVHHFSAITRRPAVMITFRPGTDLGPWFYSRAIDKEGTHWEYGHLWKALVNGVMGRDGKRRAPLVLLSDVDRADMAQAEWFRLLTDSISGRILDPTGRMVPLFRDEWGRTPLFVCTANSTGSGDSRGRMSSANVIDASILDRLGRKIESQYLHWGDESHVLMEKFPGLVEAFPQLLSQLGNATQALRKAVQDEELYGEFTHRSLCVILEECEDILHFKPTTKDILKKGFPAWLDGLDTDTRLVAQRLIDPHIEGGSLS